MANTIESKPGSDASGTAQGEDVSGVDALGTANPEPAAPPPAPESAAPVFSRDLFLLWLGQFISSIGDWCLWVAVQIAVYHATNSRQDLAFVLITEAVPFLIFSPLAGVIVDRTNRRTTMIVSDIVRAALVGLLAVPLMHPIPLWEYYAVLFCASAASAFFLPARTVVMTTVVPQRHLMRVNTLLTTCRQLADIFGPAFGGVVIAAFAQRGAFLIDVATFLGSAVCVSLLSVKSMPPSRDSKLTVKNVLTDIGDGGRLMWDNGILRGLLISWNVGLIATAIFAALMYAVSRDLLHLNAKQYGFMVSFIGVGYVASGLLMATVLNKKKPIQLLPIGLLLAMASAATYALSRNLAAGCAAMFLFGFSNMLFNVPTQTLVQTFVPRDMLGRFSSAFSVVGRLTQVFGSLIAGVAVAVSLRGIYVVAAVTYVCAAALAAYLLPQAAARMEKR